MRRLRRQALGSLVGDANGDGRVNALDLAAVKRLLNTVSTLAGRADLQFLCDYKLLQLSAIEPVDVLCRSGAARTFPPRRA